MLSIEMLASFIYLPFSPDRHTTNASIINKAVAKVIRPDQVPVYTVKKSRFPKLVQQLDRKSEEI